MNNVKASLALIVSSLNKDVAKLVDNNKIDYHLFALRSLVSYTKKLFDGLISHRGFPIEYDALSARNLFECYLLIAYINNEPSKAKDYISQKAYDELEINEGFLSLTTASTSEISIRQIQDRIDDINVVMKKNGLTPSKNWHISHLAEKTNNLLEYKAFFKLYSKYVHPSSWMVNSQDNEYNNIVFKDIFFFQGQLYVKLIIKLVSEYQDKRTNL